MGVHDKNRAAAEIRKYENYAKADISKAARASKSQINRYASNVKIPSNIKNKMDKQAYGMMKGGFSAGAQLRGAAAFQRVGMDIVAKDYFDAGGGGSSGPRQGRYSERKAFRAKIASSDSAMWFKLLDGPMELRRSIGTGKNRVYITITDKKVLWNKLLFGVNYLKGTVVEIGYFTGDVDDNAASKVKKVIKWGTERDMSPEGLRMSAIKKVNLGEEEEIVKAGTVMKAFLNEFGDPNNMFKGKDAPIPPRPFMRRGIDDNITMLSNEMGVIFDPRNIMTAHPRKLASVAGQRIKEAIRNKILTASSWAAPNKQSTIMIKGKSTPLINTGGLLNNLIYRVWNKSMALPGKDGAKPLWTPQIKINSVGVDVKLTPIINKLVQENFEFKQINKGIMKASVKNIPKDVEW